MKKLITLCAPLLLLACGTDNQSPNVDPEDVISLMSEGNELDLNSRYAWELERLADPATGEIPAGIKKRELAFAATLPAHQYKAFNWDHRGPFNVGGRTRAFAFDVLDENVMLAGGVTGGIWRSQDAGLTWTKVTDNLMPHSITSIAQDTRPGHEDTWYAGTGENYGIVSHVTFEARYSGNGLLKSTDNGVTWTELTSTQSNTPNTYVQNGDMDFVWRVVTDPSDMVNDVVLAAVFNGVYRSDDGGATWNQSLGFTAGGFSNPGSNNLDLVVTPSGIFYCTMSSDGPNKGIYRSDDGGLSWTNIKPSTFPNGWGRLTMAVNPLDENVLWFFGVANTGVANGHGVYRYQYLSGDGSGAGGAWSDRSANLPDASCLIPGLTTDIGQLSTQSSFDVHIGIHPTDTSVIYIAGTSIWRNKDAFTHDSTNTWIGGYQCSPLPYDDLNWSLSYPNHHPDQHWITFLPSDPSILVNANDGGLFKTVDNLADSVDWVPLNNGYVVTQFYGLAIEPGIATSDIIIGGLQDNGTWFTNSAAFNAVWKYIGSGDGMYCALANGGDYYITAKQNGKLYIKQIDANGNVLAHERLDPEGGPSNYAWANCLRLDPSNDKRLYWSGVDRLWRIDNLDQVPISGDRTNKEPNFWLEMTSSEMAPQAGVITAIEMCESDSGKVWYGSSNSYLYRLDNAYHPHPDSSVLVDISGDEFPFNAYISSVAVNPFNSDQIVVTFANYNIRSVFITNDGGANWDDISGNLEENPDGTGAGPAVFWAEYYVDGTIFVGTSVGLYTTNFPDGLNTVWTLESGVGNVPVDHMDFRTHDGFFAVATHGLGVFSTHLQPGFIGLAQDVVETLSVYPSLASNLIHVAAPEAANKMEIYNLSGQLVHTTTLNGLTQCDVSGFQAGTYIVVVRSNDQKWTQKIVKQ